MGKRLPEGERKHGGGQRFRSWKSPIVLEVGKGKDITPSKRKMRYSTRGGTFYRGNGAYKKRYYLWKKRSSYRMWEKAEKGERRYDEERGGRSGLTEGGGVGCPRGRRGASRRADRISLKGVGGNPALKGGYDRCAVRRTARSARKRFNCGSSIGNLPLRQGEDSQQVASKAEESSSIRSSKGRP